MGAAVSLSIPYAYTVAPSSIELTATPVPAMAATITEVAFYDGATLLATISAAPWTYTWSPVQPGTYQLTAVATDSSSNVVTSAAVPLTVINMRADFGEFSDPGAYPEPLLDMWLGVAVQMVNADRWGAVTTVGWELLTAHFTVLAKADLNANAIGGVPGVVNAPVSSKAVDKVSVSKDTAAVTFERGGDLNMTSYGIRFQRMAKLFGAGGIQLNIGPCAPYGQWVGGGWPGPPGSFS